MTEQQIFNKLVRASRAGTFPSLKEGNCVYRAADGIHKCAVGALIPDAILCSLNDVENKFGVSSLIDARPDVKKHITTDGIGIGELGRIQEVHDDMAIAMMESTRPWDHHEFCRRLTEQWTDRLGTCHEPVFAGFTETEE